MNTALCIAIALLLQIPVTLCLIGLAVVVQRTSQAAFLRTLDNREKQLAYVVQTMITQLTELSGKISDVNQNTSMKIESLQGEFKSLMQLLVSYKPVVIAPVDDGPVSKDT